MKKIILITFLAFVSQVSWTQANCPLACNDNVTVDLSASSGNTFDYNSILAAIDPACVQYFQVRLETTAGGIAIPYSPSIDLTCADVGSYIGKVSVIDNDQVLNSCWGSVEVINSPNDCATTVGPGMLPITLTANVEGPFAYGVYLNGVQLNQVTQTLYELPEADLQAGINELSFEPLLSGLNGITSLDLVYISRVISEITTNVSAIELMAADFDQSNFVGVRDLAKLRRTILGQISEDNHYFLAKSDLVNPNLDPFDFGEDMFSFRFDESAAATTDFTFNAYQGGDINFSFNLKSEITAGNRSEDTKLSYQDVRVEEGERVLVDFVGSSQFDIEALQTSFETTMFDVVNVVSNYSEAELKYNQLDGEWRMSYLSEVDRQEIQFSLELAPKYTGMLSEGLVLNPSFTQEAVHDINHASEVVLIQRGATNTDDVVVNAISIAPMPINGQSNIVMAQSGAYNLSIIDMTGQVVLRTAFSGNKYTIDAEVIRNSGIYIVQIEEGEKMYTSKVIVAK